MLFKNITIESVGPISYVDLAFPKCEERPKTLVIVGENGSGKSILLAHLVNALITGKQVIYDDVEIDKGKVFKYRSPDYIQSGEKYSYSAVEFESGDKVEEWQLVQPKIQFEEKLGYTSVRRGWT